MPIPRSFTQLTALILGMVLILPPLSAQAAPLQQKLEAQPALPPVASPQIHTELYCQTARYLSSLGYDTQTIHSLWNRSGQQLAALLSGGYLTEEVLSFLLPVNSRGDLLDRYLAFAHTHPDLATESVIIQVNMGLDFPFYENISPCAQPDSLTILVNKYNRLPDTYAPELEVLGSGYGSGSLRPQAAQAFREMADAARTDGLSLKSVSAYRSYSTQVSLYRRYVNQSGQALADTFSARAGHSEHQTGLALDINVARTSAHFENTAEFAWLQENCARFGFILRYPQGKDAITGYRFEPWHYRYVGPEIAQICMEQGLTYEEYLAAQPADPRPTVSWQGQELGTDGLLLDGSLYLSPAQLCPALGWSVQQRQNVLKLSCGEQELLLVPGRCALQNGRPLRLSSPALFLENTLLLSQKDLSFLLGLAGSANDQ